MTQWNQSSFEFEAHFSRTVGAGFNGGALTTDAGALLLRDRMSAETMRANQLRLYLSAAAYVLVAALRRLAPKGIVDGSLSVSGD